MNWNILLGDPPSIRTLGLRDATMVTAPRPNLGEKPQPASQEETGGRSMPLAQGAGPSGDDRPDAVEIASRDSFPASDAPGWIR